MFFTCSSALVSNCFQLERFLWNERCLFCNYNFFVIILQHFGRDYIIGSGSKPQLLPTTMLEMVYTRDYISDKGIQQQNKVD